MTVEEFRRLMEARLGPLPGRTWRTYERPEPPARDPQAVSFVKRDGVWEMPR